MGKPIFKLEHLQGYDIINKPCSAIVRVASDSHYLTEDNNPRYLINLRVIREPDLNTIINRVGDKTVDFSFISDLMISGAIFKDKISHEQELPIKGEKVIVTFDDINGKLRCSHVSLLPREQLEKVDLERLTKTQELFTEIMNNENILK